MGLSVGIIGLPNAGKSTLFNALVKKQQAVTGKHPFTTVEPNKGTVGVSSKRLDGLYQLLQRDKRKSHRLTSSIDSSTLGNSLRKTSGVQRRTLFSRKTPVKLTFVDIAGLILGAYKGDGLGNQFLSHIREVDCLLHVVRKFEDPTIPHIHADIDPGNDLKIVRMELMLKDLETVEKQLSGMSGWIKEFKENGEKILGKVKNGLNHEKMVRDLKLNTEEREMIESLCLLTDKPEVVVYNISEEEMLGDSLPKSPDVLTICAKLECELAGLPWVEQRQYLKEFGLPEPALNRVIRACYKKLKLLTFYTIAGGKESRAWALEFGSTAYDAAGRIHTDMQKRFIKAEVINADELLGIGSWSKAKKAGKIELHGRDYIVKDHDVLEIKFN